MNEDNITLSEHVIFGNCLKIASNKLTRRCCQITPKTKARKSKEAKALKLANELRRVLEEIMLKDYGAEGNKEFNKQFRWQDIHYSLALLGYCWKKKSGDLK